MLKDIFNYLGIAIGLGGLGWVALAILAPSVLSVVAEYLKALSPLVKGMADGIVQLTKVLWNGLQDIIDNVHTIITVALIAACAFLYAKIEYSQTCKGTSCTQCIDSIRPDYKFIKRTPQEKQEYLKQQGKDTAGWKQWLRM